MTFLSEIALMPMSSYLQNLRAKVGRDLLTMAAASVCVFDPHRRLLFAKSLETGLWMLPGGAIDPDEVPSDAAVRECFEETGLLVNAQRLIGVFGGPEFRVIYPNGDVTYYTTIAYEACIVGGSERPDGVETESLHYFAMAECDGPMFTLPSRLIARQAFNFARSAYFEPATWTPSHGQS